MRREELVIWQRLNLRLLKLVGERGKGGRGKRGRKGVEEGDGRREVVKGVWAWEGREGKRGERVYIRCFFVLSLIGVFDFNCRLLWFVLIYYKKLLSLQTIFWTDYCK